MILLDDKTPTLLTATALENAKVPDQPVDEFSKTLATTDSITQSISDSLKNMVTSGTIEKSTKKT